MLVAPVTVNFNPMNVNLGLISASFAVICNLSPDAKVSVSSEPSRTFVVSVGFPVSFSMVVENSSTP